MQPRTAGKKNVLEKFDDGEKKNSHLKVSLSGSKFERAWARYHSDRLPQVPGYHGEQVQGVL